MEPMTEIAHMANQEPAKITVSNPEKEIIQEQEYKREILAANEMSSVNVVGEEIQLPVEV